MAAKPDARRKITVDKSKPGRKTSGGRAKAENMARSKAEKDLAEAQAALALPRGQIEQVPHAQVKTEYTLAEAESVLRATNREAIAESIRTQLAAPGEGQLQSRDFFVVRLEFDRPGHSGWMEIEHGPSRTKRKFPDLDSEGLVAFIKECISPATIPEHTVPEVPHLESIVAPTLEPLRAVSRLNISDVRVFRPGDSEVMALVLNPQELFVVEARLQLQSSEAYSFAVQEPSYEMKICVIEITSGKAKLLGTCSAKLIKHGPEYAAQAEMPGLTPGLYRLLTVVTLGVPIEMAGYYDKTIIKVI